MIGTHTPGPWAWSHDTLYPVNRDPNSSAVHSILEAGGGYGYIGSNLAQTLAELDADRRLIASAPDLLEFAQEARRSGDTRLASMAIAVIAKATGCEQ